MEENEAIRALGALAHDHRMQVFRLLVRTGPDGLTAGAIAEHLKLPPSSLSFHLSQLAQAGVVQSRRESRHVYYAIDFARTRRLIAFLLEDCCLGLPELCGPRGRAEACCPADPETTEAVGEP